jgi:hypothetical protein
VAAVSLTIPGHDHEKIGAEVEHDAAFIHSAINLLHESFLIKLGDSPYQATTLRKLGLSMMPAPASKMDERGSVTKSLDTSGSSQ